MSLEKLIESVRHQVNSSAGNGDGIKDASWGYEQGCLFTREEAEAILKYLQQIKAA